ncbi:AraC family transcriptional regulator [Neisseria montereyensis]|uniref:AraC family transcriptional regulator n=1 Tax=Neisseria montereyensis TaxID=2973938 RepID=A0ABT2FC38_9NEIS|nr:AraC family transcriptional regulator [Neisseria montereyensis]MCS4533309.1 AraC family transcriptional regulator [Neisseria montereyensis]
MIKPSMIEQLKAMLPKNQTVESAIPGLYFYCADKPSEILGYIQEPSICIVLQGERKIYLGSDCQYFNGSHLMFCPVNLPLRMHIEQATTEQPVIIMSMKLEIEMIRDMLAKIPPKPKENHAHNGIQWTLDDQLLALFERLIGLLNRPEDIAVLSALIKQEIYYRLLTAEQGGKLQQLVASGSHTQQIAQATEWLKNHLDQPIMVEELAKTCGMSVSMFYQQFKEITQLSPLQYHKHLRLTEARKLNKAGNISIAQIAMQVGYESPSQFSREYKRQFGVAPSGDRG